jgi:putative phosphotransacetylase
MLRMPSRKILIEASGRHVHLSKEDLATLFGEGYELTVKKMLSQPGQFACVERIKVEGPKGSFDHCGIIGPIRKQSQVELSLTDARSIGITAPIRESGDLAGSTGIHLVGPAGEITLKEGVIIAKRHIHFTPEDAEEFGVKDKQIVGVKVGGERALTFGEVVCRVSKNYATAMHIDIDEVNACAGATEGEIVK